MTFLTLGVAATLCLGAGPAASPPVRGIEPDRIEFTAHHLYPETATWSAREGVFFVGSLRDGTVGRVTPDGRYTPFISDPRFVSTVGIRSDDAHDLLWVTNADPGASDRSTPETTVRLAGVAIYRQSTGVLLAYHDLAALAPGSHFANDVAVDAAGNAYVTDSFSPIIYRIDPDGVATVLANDPILGTEDGYNLNGIVWNPEGYLIVGSTMMGKLFKVDLNATHSISEVALPEALRGADGFQFVDARRIALAQQHLAFPQETRPDRAVVLVSDDHWRTARIERQADSAVSSPTSVTMRDGRLYMLGSRIDTIGRPEDRVSTFLLQRF